MRILFARRLKPTISLGIWFLQKSLNSFRKMDVELTVETGETLIAEHIIFDAVTITAIVLSKKFHL